LLRPDFRVALRDPVNDMLMGWDEPPNKHIAAQSCKEKRGREEEEEEEWGKK